MFIKYARVISSNLLCHILMYTHTHTHTHTTSVGFPDEIVQFLRDKGHVVNETDSILGVVQGVLRDSTGSVTAHSDSRKQGHSTVVTL